MKTTYELDQKDIEKAIAMYIRSLTTPSGMGTTTAVDVRIVIHPRLEGDGPLPSRAAYIEAKASIRSVDSGDS